MQSQDINNSKVHHPYSSDLSGLPARLHLLADLDHILELGEDKVLQLGVDEDAADLNLEGGTATHHALHLRIRELGPKKKN